MGEKGNKFLLLIGVYVFLLVLAYLLHIHLFTVNVILYSAIVDSMIAVLAVLLLLFYGNSFSLFNGFEKVMITMILLFAGYIFSISVPTIIDRSLSIYILEKIQQRGGIKLDAMKRVVIDEYIDEHRLVDVRITEQTQSGTIFIKDDCVMLTAFGNNLASFSRFFRNNLLPKKRLILGQYTDELTDPFRNSSVYVDYRCQIEDN